MKVSVIVGMLLLYAVIGLLAGELGYTEPVVHQSVPDSPESGGSIFDKIASVLAPLTWAFNAVGSLFQLATFQVEGIPPLVNILIFTPMGGVLLFSGIKLARG